MKVAFISTILAYPWGGADTLWTQAAQSALDQNDDLFLSVSPAVAADPRIAGLIEKGAILHLRSSENRPLSINLRVRRKLGLAPSSEEHLIASLQRFKPDLVVFSLGGTYDLICYSKCVGWLRGHSTRYGIIANWQSENPNLPEVDRVAAREILDGAESVSFVSSRNLEATRRHLLHALPRARVIQNPLRWKPDDVSPWPCTETWKLATVSRLEHGKGIQLLLHALAESLPLAGPWVLNIYGTGPAESYLRATASYLKLNDHIKFQGYVPNLGFIWANNHLMVSPSLDDGVPMTIPEAMLCQRAVLANAVGGAEDWVTNNETGYICAAPTTRLLIETLSHAWATRESWREKGMAAHVSAQKRYDPKSFLKLLN
jgi:glycosyltransferase involved in cell wall biosynthesis